MIPSKEAKELLYKMFEEGFVTITVKILLCTSVDSIYKILYIWQQKSVISMIFLFL